MEMWKPVDGFNGYYEVSSEGRVRSLDRYINTNIRHVKRRLVKGKMLKQEKGREYMRVFLKNGKHCVRIYTHRLVASAFCHKEPHHTQVNHINGNKLDNRACNLEWCTPSENTIHAHVTGLYGGNPSRKKIRCCETGRVFESSYKAAEWLNMNKYNFTKKISQMAQNIRDCCNGGHKSAYGYHWKDVIQEGSTTSP